MRFDIAKNGTGLTYEIRNIVNIARRLQEEGIEIIWENIGDPIQKGERLEPWMKDGLKSLLDDDCTFAYSPTKGVEETREFLAERVNNRGKVKISRKILFF